MSESEGASLPDTVAESLPDLYRVHVARLEREYGEALARADYDGLVIHSGTARIQNEFDDHYWPLRPTPAFAHWLPLGEPECALVIRPGRRPRLFRTRVTDFWEGTPEPPGDHFWDAFDVAWVDDPADVASELGGAAGLAGNYAFIGEDRPRALGYRIAEDAINPAALLTDLDAVRVYKSDYERACIREANRRAARGHRAVFDAFAWASGSDRPSELELHFLYLRATAQDDIETPYKNIVAQGEHAGVLHHVRYSRRAPVGDTSLLVDAGAVYMGYASDITRTAVVGDSAAAQTFAGLIAGVSELQAEVIRRIAPGLSYEALHDQSHALLASVLRALGVASASDDELVASGATRALFPHGLGHSLGIQVHDVGCRPRPPRQENRFLRNTSDIAPGQVFTIEPGCYFIPSLLDELRAKPIAKSIDWDLVAALAPFGGIRIENDIAVVEDGVLDLTGNLAVDAGPGHKLPARPS